MKAVTARARISSRTGALAWFAAAGLGLGGCTVGPDYVKAELDRYGLTDLVGEDAFYAAGDDLLNAYRKTTAGDE